MKRGDPVKVKIRGFTYVGKYGGRDSLNIGEQCYVLFPVRLTKSGRLYLHAAGYSTAELKRWGNKV